MPLNIDDTDNSAITGNPSNLRRVLNGFAFQIKALSGQASWKVPPHLPITQLGEKGDKGDTGATGAQGIQGVEGAQGIQGVKGDLAVSPHPGFLSGKYYASSPYSSFSTSTLIAGACYYTYFFIPFNQTFSSIAFQANNTPSNTQKTRIAIYTINNGLPSELVKDFGEISLSVPGIKEIFNSTFLSAGWYAIALSTNETVAGFYCPNVLTTNLIASTTIGNAVSGYRANAAYGAAPSTAIVSGIFGATSPVIWLKTA